MTISSAIAKALPAAESIRKWRPSTGHVYHLPVNQLRPPRAQESKESTPLPPTDQGVANSHTNKQSQTQSQTQTQKNDESHLERAAEEAFLMHMRYGGEYIDENPITGRPGEFHLSSTGRKAVPLLPKKTPETGIGAMNGPAVNAKAETGKKEAKGPKTPKSATTPRVKKKKTKMSAANTPVAL
ncbi:hypothetical protein E4U55_000392 [Claviceps digitariae]|nr:hypothetical protein E4U55_000392 [Claviceps digitariae]